MHSNNLLSHRNQEPESSVLYIVGTPIGNLEDISMRAVKILNKVSLIACEDTRITGKLLKHFKIKNKLISFHKDNSMSRLNYLINKLQEGKSIALVSDSGMPLISDPGENLVKEVKRNNFDVICIAGPCAAISALVSSGLNTSTFTFYGFMPKSNSERKLHLKSISNSQNTSIIYESPKRILKLLIDLKQICGGKRNIVLLKEITKRYETHYGNDLDTVIETIESKDPKGEYTLVISGRDNDEFMSSTSEKDLSIELKELMKAGLSHSAASNYLSKKSGRSKNEIYRLII